MRQEAIEAKNKAEAVQQQIGNLQTQVMGMQDQMNRMETLLQGFAGMQVWNNESNRGVNVHQIRNEDAPRTPTDPVLPNEVELEMMGRNKIFNQVNSTHGIHFNSEVNHLILLLTILQQWYFGGRTCLLPQPLFLQL